jgi:hypothetical protein
MKTGEVQRARMSGQVSYSLQSAVIEHDRELIAFVGMPVPIVHSSVRHAGRPLDALLLLSRHPPMHTGAAADGKPHKILFPTAPPQDLVVISA